MLKTVSILLFHMNCYRIYMLVFMTEQHLVKELKCYAKSRPLKADYDMNIQTISCYRSCPLISSILQVLFTVNLYIDSLMKM